MRRNSQQLSVIHKKNRRPLRRTKHRSRLGQQRRRIEDRCWKLRSIQMDTSLGSNSGSAPAVAASTPPRPDGRCARQEDKNEGWWRQKHAGWSDRRQSQTRIHQVLDERMWMNTFCPIYTFTSSGPRGVAGYTQVLAVGEAVMPTGPLGSLTPCKPS
jgi:hypothetical protein